MQMYNSRPDQLDAGNKQHFIRLARDIVLFCKKGRCCIVLTDTHVSSIYIRINIVCDGGALYIACFLYNMVAS